MASINCRRFTLIVMLFGLLVTVLLIPRSPLQQNVPQRDSGVFLYMGQQILNGQIPYLDLWDHKGPVIYYLNALGLFLASGSRWGVWWLQWFSLMLAAVFGYKVLSQAYGFWPAITASLAWLVSLNIVLDGGNYTEEYALALQFAALYLFWKSQESDQPHKHVFLIGVTLAIVFWIRANLIGIHLSIMFVALASRLLSRHVQKTLQWILLSMSGFLTVSIPLLGYFAWAGAWEAFVDAVFRYNSIYALSDFQSKLESVLDGLNLLNQTGLVFIAVASWTIGGLASFTKPGKIDARAYLFYVALIDLPLELLLASASGRAYSHYYMAWLPVFALSTARLVFDFLNHFAPVEISLLQHKVELKLVWLLAFLFAMLLVYQEMVKPVNELIHGEYVKTSPVLKSIWNHTDPNDYLLMWGADAKYNFMAGRQSPSRFFYQYPLYTCGYVTDAMMTEFLLDIVRNKPVIIDTSATNHYVPPLNSDERRKWNARAFAGTATENCRLPPRMGEVFAFIEAHYHVVEIIQSKQWSIYQYADTP